MRVLQTPCTSAPVPGDPSIADDDDSFDDVPNLDADEHWSSPGEAWKESLDENDVPRDAFDDKDDHPLLRRAMDLQLRLREEFKDRSGEQEASLRTLFQGAGDLMGGLSQATARYGDDDLDSVMLGLHVVQLKRALRGTAFARCALFQLRETVAKPTLDDLHETLTKMERDVFQLLAQTRAAIRPDE